MDNFKEVALSKMDELKCEMKQKFLNQIAKELAENYFEENPEKNSIDFETKKMKEIGNQIIEIYSSDFSEKVRKFVFAVEKVTLNNIIKKLKIAIAIAGGAIAVGGAGAAAVAFTPAAVGATAAVTTLAGYEAALVPLASGVVAWVSGTITSTAAGLSALFSRQKKADSSKKFDSFYFIPPEKFVEGKIKLNLCIGQKTYPLSITDN